MLTAIIFIVILAALIFVHELGHFLAARAFGIRVDAFKIGFGPKLFAWTRGGTEYGVNLIPFGGFVRIHGEDGEEAVAQEGTGAANGDASADASRSFARKPRWQQAIVLAAGVLFNFIFAWILYAAVFSIGVTASTDAFPQYAARYAHPRVMVTDVLAGSPAEKAGLREGDVILGAGAATSSIPAIQAAVNASLGKPIAVMYERDGATSTASIVPEPGIVPGKAAIGIAMNDVADLRLPLGPAIVQGVRYTVEIIKETVVGVYGLIAGIFRGAADFSQVTGPVGIYGIVGDAARMGFVYVLMITAIISVNLGVVNLIPFPALDGGRILFVAIEAAVRRRIPHRVANIVNLAGFALLIVLMIAITWKDIAGLLRG